MLTALSKYRSPVLVGILCLLLALVVHHVRVMVFEDDFRRAILADLYLLDGKPQWRVEQSRLLGPFIARTLMNATRNPDAGYVLFDLAGFGAALLLAWRIGMRIVGSRAGALAATLTMALGLVALFVRVWFFAFDVVSLALFMTFAWMIVIDAGTIWLVLLFSVAIWNREDALFIGLYIAIQPFADWWRARGNPSRPPIAWRRALVGVTCIVAGMILIKTLRDLLLVHETGPEMFGVQPPWPQFLKWNVARNYSLAVRFASSMILEMPVFYLLPPLIAVCVCAWLAVASGGRYLAYALVNLAFTAATIVLGLVPELREWVELLPAVVLATATALATIDSPAKGSAGATTDPPASRFDE